MARLMFYRQCEFDHYERGVSFWLMCMIFECFGVVQDVQVSSH